MIKCVPETGHCVGAQGIQLSSSGLPVGLEKTDQFPGTFRAFPVASVKYLARSNLKGFIVISWFGGIRSVWVDREHQRT